MKATKRQNNIRQTLDKAWAGYLSASKHTSYHGLLPVFVLRDTGRGEILDVMKMLNFYESGPHIGIDGYEHYTKLRFRNYRFAIMTSGSGSDAIVYIQKLYND